jgi:hypothetical protein
VKLAAAALLASGCVVFRAPTVAQRPYWRVTGDDHYAAGCVLGHAVAEKSGREGVGVSLQLRSVRDCRVAIRGAHLAIGGHAVTVPGLPELALAGRSQTYAWLPVRYDGKGEWNADHAGAQLVLDVMIDGQPAPPWTIALHDGMDLGYARDPISADDAPGTVADLATPPAHENGDPARHELPGDPGAVENWIWGAPYIVGGRGRNGDGAGELGFEVRYEHHTLDDVNADAYGEDGQVLFSGGIATQWRNDASTFGVAYAQIGVRGWSKDAGPGEVAIGPVVSLDGRDYGAQLTMRVLVVFPIVMRYTRDGFELMAGIQIPVPYISGSSR